MWLTLLCGVVDSVVWWSGDCCVVWLTLLCGGVEIVVWRGRCSVVDIVVWWVDIVVCGVDSVVWCG